MQSEKMKDTEDNYIWNYFHNLQELYNHRLQALSDVTAHRNKFPNRYIAGSLPSLPFDDNEFDAILSDHFLFMYDDRLDEAFHLQTINKGIFVCGAARDSDFSPS